MWDIKKRLGAKLLDMEYVRSHKRRKKGLSNAVKRALGIGGYTHVNSYVRRPRKRRR